MDALWGAETTRRAPLACAFVAGNLVESGLMAIGAVPSEMLIGVALAPLMLGAMMLPMALLVGGNDVFAGAVIAVLGVNAAIFAIAFAKGAALVVDELTLASQTLAAWCVFATLAMPWGWGAHDLRTAVAGRPWTTAVLALATIWTLVYVLLRPRVPRLAAFATVEWFALCVVLCCYAALHGSDFDCLWPGDPLPESLLHSFAAGMALFYLLFHAALFLIPTYGWVAVRNDAGADGIIDFVHTLEDKLVARGAPRWLIVACVALQAGTWALIYTRRLIPPPAVLLFVALGFSHVFLIELKRFVATRDRP
jgi:hypothetical protein